MNMPNAGCSAAIPENPMPLRSWTGIRSALLALGIVALLAGLWGALGRLGWPLPHGAALAALHGPLMISGLFGTLIGLERAVALDRGWSYVGPAFSGFGTLALLAGAPLSVGAGAYAAAAAVLAGGSLLITIQQPALFNGALLFGALAWLAGNILWLTGQAVPDLVGWWLAFLVLTIAGERLELSRLMPRRRGSEALFLFAVGLLVAGAQNGLMSENGAILFGLALLVSTLWLMRHDIALVNVRRTGQTRFMAACMLAGYAWLGAAGLSLIWFPPGESGLGYDVALHAILIGFVLSMVFGHALIILPAVARVRLRYGPVLYAPLILLHASMILRASAGIAGWEAGRMASGILTLIALVSFAASLAIASRNGRETSQLPQPRQSVP
ncbi:hypothetical protein [Microvirga guangxiensis]|uniref:Uncharacterized protein n=1 Tax=Microvirga guangxiensis TaxID=549386 RepID=A0A1G5K052_9HYPH|nr:hypothetical protein [Microvirga guangxiensis]SCY93987.1 hypothetical protein SAMN02927923_02960 [Microvirga guangxiensis]